jgi:ribosomal protein L32E
LARSKAKLQLLSRKPRTSKSVFRIHLSTQPQPVRICWEKFKPVTPVKPISSESRLLRKLLLSGLLLTH